MHRVYCEIELNMKRRTKKRVMTLLAQPLDHMEKLNQVWSLGFRDILYDSRSIRTLNVIDEGNREGLRI